MANKLMQIVSLCGENKFFYPKMVAENWFFGETITFSAKIK